MTDPARRVAAALRALSEATGAFGGSDLGFAVVDDDRAARLGLPEVVFGAGKTPAQIAAIMTHLRGRGQRALATRVGPEAASAVRAELPEVAVHAAARLLWWAPEGEDPFAPTVPGRALVVTGGTSDLPVAEEAAWCARWFGLDTALIPDIGVAGLHRTVARLPELLEADVIIAVAGMEGALPSVLAGLVRAPIVAVPTSVGYGAHLDGWTPLLAMLTGCAAGVSVVNVDNGFGAAQVAWRILAGRR